MRDSGELGQRRACGAAAASGGAGARRRCPPGYAGPAAGTNELRAARSCRPGRIHDKQVSPLLRDRTFCAPRSGKHVPSETDHS
ncbi:Znf821 isoform B [Columba livia]|nr:Znf821 isoform B [Columba livia]